MGIANLSNIVKIFGGSPPTEAEKHDIFKEALLMTLARASSADSNIDPVEVETVRKVFAQLTGDEVADADVRHAAASAIYEKAPLAKYLTSVSKILGDENCAKITQALAEVIKTDVRITTREIEFFNMAAQALKVSPAAMVGMFATTP